MESVGGRRGQNGPNNVLNLETEADNAIIIDFLGMLPEENWIDSIFPFVGIGKFALIAPVCRTFKRMYLEYGEKIPMESRPRRMGTILPGDQDVPITPFHTLDSAAAENRRVRDYVCQSFDPNYCDVQRKKDKKIIAAARTGDATVTQNFTHPPIVAEWNTACFYAALHGQQQACEIILQRLRDFLLDWSSRLHREREGEPERERYDFSMFFVEYYVVYGAAARGDLDFLQWALGSLEGESPPWRNTMQYAVANGQLAVLPLISRQLDAFERSQIAEVASEHNQTAVLEYVRDNQLPWDDDRICVAATKHGSLEVLKFLRDNNCRCDIIMCCLAAVEGGLVTLFNMLWKMVVKSMQQQLASTLLAWAMSLFFNV